MYSPKISILKITAAISTVRLYSSAPVKQSAAILQKMNALVTGKVYPGMPHTISQDEITEANRMIFAMRG